MYLYLQTVSEVKSTREIFNSIDFYIGRLSRILPVYYLCLIAGDILMPFGFVIDPNGTTTTRDYGNFNYRYLKWGRALVSDLI